MEAVSQHNVAKTDQKRSSAIQRETPIDFLLNAAAQPLAIGPSAIKALLELSESFRSPEQCGASTFALRLKSFENFAQDMLKKFREIEAVIFFGSAIRGKSDPGDIDIAFITAADYRYMTPCNNLDDYKMSLRCNMQKLLRNKQSFSFSLDLAEKRVDDSYYPHRPTHDIDGSQLDSSVLASVILSGPFFAILRDGKIPKLVASTTADKYKRRGHEYLDSTGPR